MWLNEDGRTFERNKQWMGSICFKTGGVSVFTMLILEALLDNKTEWIISFHPLNNTKTAASEVHDLFFWIELIVILELVQDTVEMRFFTRFLMFNCRYCHIERTIAQWTYEPRTLCFS